jgi:hypothetical protein
MKTITFIIAGIIGVSVLFAIEHEVTKPVSLVTVESALFGVEQVEITGVVSTY